MSASVAIWVQADWRRRYMSLVVLALVAGISFAFAIAALAGARRTATSFDRLREATLAYDHGVVIDAPGASQTGDDSYDAATVARIRGLPEIESVGGLVIYMAAVPNADWDMSLNVPEDEVVGSRIAADRVVRGRLPDPTRVDEVAINEATVDQVGVDVGDVLTLETMSPDQQQHMLAGDEHAFDDGLLGPDLGLRVVGVLRGTPDVTGRAAPNVYGTPAFDREYRGRIAYSSRILAVRRAEGYSTQQFDDAVDEQLTGFRLGAFTAEDENQSARRMTHTLALGLSVFGLVAALVSVLVVNQAVVRHVNGTQADHPALAALGLTRGQRVRGVVGIVAPAALAAAGVAVIASYAASAFMPIGVAHRIEPEPGLRLDAFAAIAGGTILVATILVSATLAALSATRQRDASDRSQAQLSRVSAALATLGLGPVAGTGIRLAFDRRSPALPVRSTIIAVAAALAVLAGALTFAASLDRLESSPDRWGYGWDLVLDPPDGDADQLATALASNPSIDGLSVLQRNFTYIDAGGHVDGIRAYGLGTRTGHIGYALISGDQPDGSDEVVVGPALADDARLGIGDVMQVAICPCTGDEADPEMTSVRVVGVALFPEADDATFNRALGFSDRGFAAHVGNSEATRVALFVQSGENADAVANDLGERFPGTLSAYSYPSRPGDVANLGGLRSFPRALVAVAVLLGSAVLLNMLLATRQRRRRELATLSSLGLTSGAIRNCVIWQSIAIVSVSLVLGTVAGVGIGAAVWVEATKGIGVATDVNRPLSAIVTWSCLALATAIVLGAVAGMRASRLATAASLRDE